MAVVTADLVHGGHAELDALVNEAHAMVRLARGGELLLSSGAYGLLRHQLGTMPVIGDVSPRGHTRLSLVDLEILGMRESSTANTVEGSLYDFEPGGLAVGLADVLVELKQKLEDGAVLISGPSGSGKTRLAFEAARDTASDYPDGVWWVDLYGARAPEAALALVAAELGLPLEFGVDSRAVRSRLSQLLRGQRLLIVLDAVNFEPVLRHLTGALDEIAGPLRYIATTTLRRRGRPVVGLPHPAVDPKAVATDLLVSRVSDARNPRSGPNAPLLLAASQLAESPMTIELLAGAAVDFSREEVTILTEQLRSADDPVATLLGIALVGEERDALACLAGHDSAFSRERVDFERQEHGLSHGSARWIDRLTRRGIIRRATRMGRTRYRVPTPIRRTLVRSSFFDEHTQRYAMQVALTAFGDQRGVYSGAALTRLDMERRTIYAALESLSRPTDRHRLVELLSYLSWYWFERGALEVGTFWLSKGDEVALDLATDHDAARAAFVANGAAALALRMNDLARAERAHKRALALVELLAHADAPRLLGFAHNGLGLVELGRRNREGALAHFHQALAYRRRNRGARAITLDNLGHVSLLLDDDPDAAWDHYLAAYSLRRAEDDPKGAARSRLHLGRIAHLASAPKPDWFVSGQEAIRKAVQVFDQLNHRTWAVEGVEAIAEVLAAKGNFETAATYFGAAEAERQLLAQQWLGPEARRVRAAEERVRAALGSRYQALRRKGEGRFAEVVREIVSGPPIGRHA